MDRSKKTSVSELDGIDVRDVTLDGELDLSSPSRYVHMDGSKRFDLLWYPKSDSKSLFVMFAGDAERTRYKIPIFQRWSWAKYFNGSCLFISDPTLEEDSALGLAWYAGTSEFDPMPVIVQLVERFRSQFQIPAENVFAYGSSGGGFAALKFASLQPNVIPIVINPQTDIALFSTRRKVDYYISTCFGGMTVEAASELYPTRFNILNSVSALANRKLVYIQNTSDKYHYRDHYLPFCAAMGSENTANEDTGDFRRILFSHEGGHAYAETQDEFNKAMAIARSWES